MVAHHNAIENRAGCHFSKLSPQLSPLLGPLFLVIKLLSLMSESKNLTQSYLLRLTERGHGNPLQVRLEVIGNESKIYRFADLDSFFDFLRQRSTEKKDLEPTTNS